MASPQLENGHSRIAHELLEKIYRSHPSANEFCVILSIIRHSYGWGKKSASMSISFLATDTNLSERSVSHALSCLKLRKIITREGSETGIQKDYNLWNTLQSIAVVQRIADCNPLQEKPAIHCRPPLQPIADKKEIIKERKKERPSASLQVQCRQHSYDDFKIRTGQAPSWGASDYRRLADLFKEKKDITLDDYQSRWRRFVESKDGFMMQQGMRLRYFAANYDRFIRSNGFHSKADERTENNVQAAKEFVRRHSQVDGDLGGELSPGNKTYTA